MKISKPKFETIVNIPENKDSLNTITLEHKEVDLNEAKGFD
jgi:hypothetical protein